MTPRRLNRILEDASPDVKELWTKACERKYGKVKAPKRPRGMNKTEAKWASRLALSKSLRQIRNYRYTGHRRHMFKLANGRFYNPDFIVRTGRKEVHEVKGAYIWPDSILKFDIAAGMYPQYVFRVWQWTKNGWLEVRTRNDKELIQETR